MALNVVVTTVGTISLDALVGNSSPVVVVPFSRNDVVVSSGKSLIAGYCQAHPVEIGRDGSVE